MDLERTYPAFLFDMDGTLLTSIAAAERVWTRWAQLHGLDPGFVPSIHGARALDTVRRVLPDADAQAEAARITAWEIEDVDGVEAIAGAAAFTASLPAHAWAIVTSAPRELALRRLQAAGLPPAPVMVTAEDVERGKPDPSGYRLAAQRLGVDAAHCLIFEDAPAGIGAAEAAGAEVLVITATHAGHVDTPHRSARDFLGLQAEASKAGLQLRERAG
ncbi:HAD-IA family hydrolase [Pseudoxanthomonas sp. JBR18]|uniref:HAD-IA family hydrolase n=1 Tax=Pseudoxanthomonas sp. JBR18 TaxID=2969308 RepID=UPI002305AF51|nr:HAD-IA family hydrolase [Pseudoxanthomonas sp. JBR18]WCE05795.1 HAD-IA family hydrolase [Pseudoxanthomonas sp. JBR18]